MSVAALVIEDGGSEDEAIAGSQRKQDYIAAVAGKRRDEVACRSRTSSTTRARS